LEVPAKTTGSLQCPACGAWSSEFDVVCSACRADLDVASSRPAPPAFLDLAPEARVLGPYRLVRPLGRGGFAPVWLAEEIYGGRKLRDVALKLFFLPEGTTADPAGASAWRQDVVAEAGALCRVEHPNVVRFHALARDDAHGVVGLAMEYLGGPSLATLAETAELSARAILDAAIDVAWALSAVHDAGLVHRDVKPANVVLGASGYKLIDFGIVGHAGRTPPASLRDAVERPREAAGPVPSTQVGLVAGTAGYMAPECVSSGAPASSASDLYALGVTLFELATGGLPPGPPALAAAAAIAQAARFKAILPDDDPAARPLAERLARLLAADPSARPRHADWVARELERIRALLRPAAGTSAPPASPPVVPSAAAPLPTAPARPGAAGYTDRDLVEHPPLVGREDALLALARASDEALRGAARVALITGPLGIGRTRLLDAAAAAPGFASGVVLRAGCSPERRGPLRPLLRALEARRAAAEHEAERAARGGPPDGATAVLREAIERAVSAALRPADHGEGNALEGVEDALLCMAERAPVLLAVDDLQWGDAHTLELLRLLVERADSGAPARLLVVATARDEPQASSRLRALLGQIRAKVRPAARHVALGPIAGADAAALAQAVLPVTPEIAEAAVRGAGGTPFFLVHALSAWRQNGAITRSGGVWRAADHRVQDEPVPGVGDLLEARLASCLEDGSPAAAAAPRVLACVALHGGGLGIEVILRTGLDADAAEEALEAMVGAGILIAGDEGREYGFAQEMVRQAALNLVRRRPWLYRLHKALLDAIAAGEGAGADAVFLATGYEKLGLRDEARTWLARAASDAALAGLFAEAAELSDRLAALTAEPERRAEVELSAVRALLKGRLFDEAGRRLRDLEARAEVLGGSGGALPDVRRRIYRLELACRVEQAGVTDPSLLADADALGDPAIACEARMALAGTAQDEEAMRMAGEAVALAERCGPALEFAARVLRVELGHASNRCDLTLVESDLRRALAIAAATRSTWQQIHISGDLAIVEADLGRLDASIERLRGIVEEARARAMRWQLRISSNNLAAMLLRAGRLDEAAGVAASTAELARSAGDPVLCGSALSLRAEALRRAGALDAALASAGEAEQVQRQHAERGRALTLLRRAEILEALGRGAEALADARRARGAAEQCGDRDLALGAGLWERLHLLDGGAAAEAALGEALAAAEQSGVTLRPLTLSLVARARERLAAARATA
jgi:serine/threonine protein kinase/tetratricopeptide (TPR) repeat protein